MATTLQKDAVKLACATCGQVNRVPTDKLSAGPKCGTCGEPLMSGKVAELDPKGLTALSKKDDLPVLVDFWAPWCGPCRMMAPEFAKAAQELKGRARFAKINTEEHPTVSMKNGIRGIPALILYQGGKEVARIAGARPARDIVAFVMENGKLPA
ncbi:thioredoxin [Celeribacter baekdonensis]|jgi:thioredoxin 2|uniref:Thioredoxin n=1 Tax=Celeribacter baekdonensis TaxID=875171 RepID=A0A1G7KC65_9RHOB|nr:thioredoxin TrxC [Celeribacter baekdonensis]SDF34813.1 thioredoxin [Celeribacter baekdonensis]